jgi:hypothetical protein
MNKNLVVRCLMVTVWIGLVYEKICSGEIIQIVIMTLFQALPPPLWHLPVAIVLYYVYAIVEKFPVQLMPGHRNAP